MADRNLVLQLLITAKDQASAALRGIRDGVSAVGEAASSVLEPLRSLGGVLTAALGIGGGKELLDRADAFTRLSNSLKIATTSEEAYQAALKDVAAIAGRTNADIEVTAQLYGKVAQSAKELGLSQQQVGQLTEVISKGMQLSGASAETASGAILQLTQAFSGGALRGEEFNSVMEASPELMRQLAAGLGVTIGELRGLAEQGALTSRAVSAALLAQKDAIDKAYGETTRTVGQSFTNLNNQLILYVGKLNESTGATAAIGGALKLLADNLNVVAAAAGAGLATALGKSTQALISYAKESIAARAAARDHALAAAAQREAALAAAQGNVAAAQAAVNRAMAEQRAAQAALQAATGDQAVTSARAAATAAAQSATAATTRYIAAQSALNTAQSATATETGLLSRAMGFLAGPGGVILLAVSAFAALLPLLSKSKTDLDALTVSTDQYRDSIKGLNEAQLLANIQKLNEGIREQEDVTREAEAQVNKLRDGHRNLFEVLSDSRSVAEQLTEAEGKLADARQKLAALQGNLQVSTEALGQARQQESADLGKQLVQYSATKVAMEKYATELDALGKQQKGVAAANQERIQAEIDLAKASGDLEAVDRLTLELAGAKASAAQRQADLDRAAAVAAAIKLDAVQKEYNLIRDKQPKDEEGLRLAQQDVEQKTAQAAASAAVATALETQAKNVAHLNTAQLAQLSRQESLLTAQKSEALASAALAREKGYEYEARQNLIRVAEIEAQLALLSAERKQIEADAAIALVKEIQDEIQGKLDLGEAISDIDRARLKSATNTMNVAAIELEAAGKVAEAEVRKAQAVKLGSLSTDDATDKTKGYTEAVDENSDFVEQASLKQKEHAKTVDNVSTMYQGMINQLNNTREAMQGLSEKSALYFDMLLNGKAAAIGLQGGFQAATASAVAFQNATRDGSDDLAKFIKAETEAQQAAGSLRKDLLFSVNDFDAYTTAISLSAAETKAAFYDQAAAAEQLRLRIAAMADSGRLNVGELDRAARLASDGFDLLDNEDLANLRSEIEAATEKLKEMQQETQDARNELQSLNAELLEAQGQDEKAELLRQELDYQTRLAEIEQRRREAELTGNRELVAILDRQAAVLRQINDAKVKNIQADTSAEAAGDKVAQSWDRAAGSIKSAGAALASVHNISTKVAQTDLSGLNNQMNSLATSANRLREVL